MEDYNTNYGSVSNDLMTKIFTRMFSGLLVTALVAAYVYFSGAYINIILGGAFRMLLFAELIVVIVFSLLFKKLSPGMVTLLFYLYSVINGVTMSVVFAAYQINSIFYAFFMSAILFGALAIYGHNTEKPLTSFGSILSVALWVGIIFSLINLFMGSTMLDIILDWVILFIFCGLTIYDVNKIKFISESSMCEPEKLYVYCAMDLYLDFINIFLRLISIMGKRRK